MFIKKLTVTASKPGSKLNILTIDSLGADAELKQQMAAGWTDLILGPVYEFSNGGNTRQFGLDLIVASIYRNGFAFGGQSFLYLLGTEVKAKMLNI